MSGCWELLRHSGCDAKAGERETGVHDGGQREMADKGENSSRCPGACHPPLRMSSSLCSSSSPSVSMSALVVCVGVGKEKACVRPFPLPTSFHTASPPFSGGATKTSHAPRCTVCRPGQSQQPQHLRTQPPHPQLNVVNLTLIFSISQKHMKKLAC